jgi:hypothetical protein
MGGQNQRSFPPKEDTERSKPGYVSRFALIILVLTMLLKSRQTMAADGFSLLAVAGGITGTLSGSDYINTFGTMNALGIGTPNESGLTVAQLSNGALYFSEFQVQFSGMPAGHKGGLSAYVSTNFAHPAAQVVYMCPDNGTCTASSGYSALPTSVPATPNIVVSPGVANGTAVVVGIGIFLPDNNGPTSFTGVDNGAVVTFNMYDLSSGNPTQSVATATWTFNGTPNQTVQNAVQFTLGTAPGGLTVAAGADYTMAFGSVDGLGIESTAGLTTTPAAGGIIYHTPYLINTAFTDFSSTTGSISVYVSTPFAHPAVLTLEDASAAAGPFTAISTNPALASQTKITSTAADRGSFTRFLGLFVSSANSPTTLQGSDSATLTFTLTVP